MPIRYSRKDKSFHITTKNTLYAFKVVGGKYLVHTYYGKKNAKDPDHFEPYCVSFAPYLEEFGNTMSPDIFPQELSTFGCGDFRCDALRIRNSDGNSSTSFDYVSYKVIAGRETIDGIPFARADENTTTLIINLRDPATKIEAQLFYTAFYECDVISRYIKIKNPTKKSVTIEKCMPLCLDLPGCDYDWVSLFGGHYDERHVQRTALHHGAQSVFSRRGASSPQFNPFIALCSKKATQSRGDVFGFNFVWSGSFLDEIEVDQCDNTRVAIGLGSDQFAYTLDPGDTFESPEAVMTYSKSGFDQMTLNFHHFVNSHIAPPESRKARPVVLNTWEACYFNIDEEKLLAFAEEAKKTGIDMLVVDDGWFGARNHDRAGLGDWVTNTNKFKDGIGAFGKRVNERGLSFGIWVEPEMVNPDSDLYRAHPEWCLRCPKREGSLSRNQLVLDMSNPDVVAYLKDSFEKVFAGVPVSYFKWDMNRHISEAGSAALPPERQKEVWFRYIKGTYELLGFFRERFPEAMIETCSGGGGRYDLGMMALSSQIWASDNTNPYDRMWMQHSALIAYPASVMSCHVSNPRDDLASLDFRYKVAVSGVLGYELNILRQSDAVKEVITKQVADYRRFADMLIDSDYHALASPFEVDHEAHYYISSDRSRILFGFAQKKNMKAGKELCFRIKEADADKVYTEVFSGKKYQGKDLKDGIKLVSEEGTNKAVLMYFEA